MIVCVQTVGNTVQTMCIKFSFILYPFHPQLTHAVIQPSPTPVPDAAGNETKPNDTYPQIHNPYIYYY